MPNLTFPKSALEPRPALPVGPVEVMFKGFKPALSKKREGKEQSINLFPELVIVNDSRSTKDGKPMNGQKVFEALNLTFAPRLMDFFHAFGVDLIENGDNLDIPGAFANGTDNPDPSKWGQYTGPILNEVGTLILKEVPSQRKNAKPTDTDSTIQRYVCRVPGCTYQHMEDMS